MIKKISNYFCIRCGQYKNSRPLSVDAIIIKDKKILLIKRSGIPYKGYWALPGGFVDKNETVEDALIRETKEETGLSVIKYTLLGIYSKPSRHPKQLIAASYIVCAQGKLKAGDDALECNYYPLDNLPENIAFDHRKMIEDAIKYEIRMKSACIR